MPRGRRWAWCEEMEDEIDQLGGEECELCFAGRGGRASSRCWVKVGAGRLGRVEAEGVSRGRDVVHVMVYHLERSESASRAWATAVCDPELCGSARGPPSIPICATNKRQSARARIGSRLPGIYASHTRTLPPPSPDSRRPPSQFPGCSIPGMTTRSRSGYNAHPQ